MAKKIGLQKVSQVALMIAGIVALVGIGGLFIAGGFMNVVILKILPLIIHQTVGWIIIVAALLSAVASIAK